MKSNNPKRFEATKPIEVYHSINKNDSSPHWHFCYLITLSDGGNGVEIKNGIKYNAVKGKISVLSPSDIHYNEVGSDGFISYYGVKFTPDIYGGAKDSF